MEIVVQKVSIRIFLVPLAVMGLALFAESWLLPLLPNPHPVAQVIDVVFWLSIASLFNRGLAFFFWQPMRCIHKVQIPKLLINLTSIAVWLCAVVLVLNIVFNQSIVGIVTTSTVAFGVAGLALRDFIADFFAGIVLSVEQQIKIGDWVELGGSKGVGRVVEIGSRSSRLVTTDEGTLIVPNTQLTGAVIQNYHLPEMFWRDRIYITFGYEVTADQVKRILLSAAKSIPEIVAVPREVRVEVSDYTERGVLWKLKYWIPDYGLRYPLRAKLNRQILRNIHYADLAIPYPKSVLLRGANNLHTSSLGVDTSTILRKNVLFLSLKEEELQIISEKSEKRIYVAGDKLIRQGDSVDFSFFILHSGLLGVFVNEVKVAELIAGSFFGEMSLLTGAPRSATITAIVDSFVIRISKDLIGQLLQLRPEIACAMGEVLAERQLANRKASEGNVQPADYEEEKKGLTDRLAAQIRGFFFGSA